MVTFNAPGPGMGASIDGSAPAPCNLEVHQEWIDVSSALPTRKPDPSWELVDKHGHFHAFTSDGKLPTLDEEKIRKPCPGGCDDSGCTGTVVIRYRCKVCKKKIRPGWISDYDGLNRKIPGRLDWSVTVIGGPILVTWGEVSVRVTADGRTYFGFGRPGDVTWRNVDGRPVTETVIHGTSELGRRDT